MVFKKISFLFVISLAFGFASQNQIKDVPFEVNDVINQVSPQSSPIPNPQNLNPSLPSGEFLIDTSIVYVVAGNYQQYTAVAFDGTNYLVVWEDSRNGNVDIYGTRINQAGFVFDTAGIPISTGISYNRCSPSVAFDGTNYLVAWQDRRNGYPAIYCARINQAGVVLDPAGIPISTVVNTQFTPSVAFDGTNYLVVWEDMRNNNHDIYGARIDQAGFVLDLAGIPISTAVNRQIRPSVAFDGTNYMVVWDDRRNGTPNIFGARVTPTGSVLDDTGFSMVIDPNFNGQLPAVIFGGTNYLVVWQDGRNGPVNWDIYGARVTPTGILLDTNGIPMSTAAGYQQFPSVAFDGTNFLAVWLDQRAAPPLARDIYGTRISQAGTVLDPTGIPVSTAPYGQMYPSVAFDGSNYLVAWADHRSNNIPDIYVTQVTPTGTILDSIGILISTAASSQWNSSVAFDGTNYLAVWEEERNDNIDIYGVRVNQTGIVLDSSLIPISIAPNKQYSPSVAFDGTNYMVVWSDKRSSSEDIYGSRVSITGLVLDPEGIPISTAPASQFIPSIAFDGINYLVVWQDRDGDISHVYGSRVDQDGIVLDPTGILISTVGNFQKSPSVAFDGNNYLVVWMSWWGGPNDPEIYGVRVDQQGNIIPPFIQVTEGCFGYQKDPSVAFDGTNYFIVWRDDREANIYGARVSQTGIVLDPNGFAISTANYNQSSPSVAFDGTNFFVVWQDKRSGIYYDIYGAKVNQSGTVIEGYHVSTQSGDQLVPTIAHGSGNELLITYTSWTDSINHRPVNTYRIWGKFASSCSLGITKQNPKVKMQSAKLLEIYPNPAKGVMRVRGPFSEKDIKIFDVSGKMIKEIEILRFAQNDRVSDTKISLKEINPGIYFLRLGKETKKFIVTR